VTLAFPVVIVHGEAPALHAKIEQQIREAIAEALADDRRKRDRI